jgi:hypothetical protein
MISGVELLIEGLNLDVDWDSEQTDGTQLRACLGNGGIKWMEEDWRGFWEILTYNGNSPPQYHLFPFIPLVPKQGFIGIPTLILPQLSPSLHWRHYPVPGSLPYLLLLFSIPSFYTAGALGPVSFLYRFNDTVAQTKSMVSIRTAVRRNEN